MSAYLVNPSIEYPDRQLNRVTTTFRIVTAIPILAHGTNRWTAARVRKAYVS